MGIPPHEFNKMLPSTFYDCIEGHNRKMRLQDYRDARNAIWIRGLWLKRGTRESLEDLLGYDPTKEDETPVDNEGVFERIKRKQEEKEPW